MIDILVDQIGMRTLRPCGSRSMRAMLLSLCAFTASILCFGCSWLDFDSHWRSGRYVVLAIDTMEQMNLAFDIDGGGAIGIVGPTVFGVGGDDRYIVVKRHPNEGAQQKFDRTITEYFVVTRINGEKWQDAKAGVKGPLTKEAFDQLRVSLSLPNFTKTIAELQ